jgi:hypothetical protein
MKAAQKGIFGKVCPELDFLQIGLEDGIYPSEVMTVTEY